MRHLGLGTKNAHAGEDHQQFNRLTDIQFSHGWEVMSCVREGCKLLVCQQQHEHRSKGVALLVATTNIFTTVA
jgi:hypothetical protein